MVRDPEFDEWWARYPLRVGKLAARVEYGRARTMASAAVLLAGVERYKQSKPLDRPWCHPRTWLHQGRWLDEDSAPPVLTEKTAKTLRGAVEFLKGGPRGSC